MKTYIRIKDGLPFEHPVLEQNLIQSFPDVDLNNLPKDWAEFEKTPLKFLDVYEMCDGVSYVWEGTKIVEKHLYRQMTQEEKQEKINNKKQQWKDFNGPASFVFNEQTCEFEPPIPHPEGDEIFVWDEQTASWIRPK